MAKKRADGQKVNTVGSAETKRQEKGKDTWRQNDGGSGLVLRG